MPASDDHPTIHGLGTIYEPRDGDLRYMRRRRIGTSDRNGDPLDGLVNLFDVAVVLAVGLLVAALTAAGLSGLLTEKNMTIVTDPGTPQMQVVVKESGKITAVDMNASAQRQGIGTLLGSFYKLADGSIVYVPADGAAPPGASALPGATPSPYPTTNPYASPTPSPPGGASSTPGALPAGGAGTPAPVVTPTPGVTATPGSQG